MRMQRHVAREFQSTPSVWRETPERMLFRLPCTISIHSLRVEGDRSAGVL